MTSGTAIDYSKADLESLDFPVSAFDLAYSSLALHYVEDLSGLFAKIYRALALQGELIFSIEHPIYMAPSKPEWLVEAGGHKVWPLDRYLIEGPRSTDWITPGVIKQYRTIGTKLILLIRAVFTLNHVKEWG